MIPLTLSALCQPLNARLLGSDVEIAQVSSDSRVITEKTLFVALKGEHFDGHNFAASTVEAGAVALLVDHELPLNIPQLVVKDTQKAMGDLGAYLRSLIQPKSVALTGSNGKTSVKEMVATILSQDHKVLYTAGNFNNEIGVPLTLLRLETDDEFGVFELGANHKGEINYTSSLVKPQVALVNNVASAHLEGFGSLEGVASAKSEIFNHLAVDGTAVINADDQFASVMFSASAAFKQLSFGIDSVADIKATELDTNEMGCYRFVLSYQAQRIRVELPLSGRHQVSNALAATAICLSLGLTLDEIKLGFSLLVPVKGRMLPTQLGRVRVIDDSYNANPASVTAAIDWLQEIEGYRCLVLGDLGELGDNASLLHAELGELAKLRGLDALFTLGELSTNASRAFGVEANVSLEALVENVINNINQLQGNATVLVKGSRSARMERVVEALISAYGRGEFV
ncbi:UDP-N-acetylmuramoyl-tripeptide--D-alanyl-D-alanine ligase [Shewanella eurypsychrophilus]|uniref:UDP-N-acetylmuramoyl-tripeptide--D-alanyl-D-alanine ligase n=1 Tax=Shewanella eurypsychrophilus TaxID=2593656 RepID=A0ABX6V126_9GAMM|nr:MULTISPECIES: UDP-N-acetylmuramoyl-tripeptide--D-alanyl-D-alanine ligase [Shewanella]QFU20727.1 UDP-N-acetylmuramoyl-tripeptide--D-alanyl-D-alanine ligase [Shewanella sp. YLB-09]QFU21005.1 UDP-N-acetylmuramoyl-tripeptide--D-alanyl-D-alanine ligase [Shewanella sp. YLB-09]QPG56294.1 UDP-N-acetylmuramoyl-tripeptide--D-alanyl-D-alanine ligase [Shewanella eurypsychrophilus]